MSAGERRESVEAASRRTLEHNWEPTPGFTVPNRRRYPWLWLWDSCFHAIAWSGLGDARCVTELESVLSLQLPSGFVPHMGYFRKPAASLRLWSSPGRSDITQPPMFGHALRVLAARGFDVGHLLERASAGLDHLFEQRLDPGSGLIRVVHPWETGADDSPRWDGCCEGPFRERRWNRKKSELVRSLELRDGAAAANPGFDVGSTSFSALVAFNAMELATLTGDGAMRARASALGAALAGCWTDGRRTWSDVCLAGPWGSSGARTLDALFPLLVSQDADHVALALADLFGERSFWRAHGPSSTAADEPSYRPRTYWRGDAWPQELYLLMVAAGRLGRQADAQRLAERLVEGCIVSGYSERWDSETGAGLGASPQGWAALASEGLRVAEQSLMSRSWSS